MQLSVYPEADTVINPKAVEVSRHRLQHAINTTLHVLESLQEQKADLEQKEQAAYRRLAELHAQQADHNEN